MAAAMKVASMKTLVLTLTAMLAFAGTAKA
jgi:hypothetical protein